MVKRNIFIGVVIEMKLYLVGRVSGQAREGAVEVAIGGGSLRKLFDHVKVVLLHLIFHIWSCVQCTIDCPSPTLQYTQGTIFLFCMMNTFWQGLEQNTTLVPS